jgi:hypothetical protein
VKLSDQQASPRRSAPANVCRRLHQVFAGLFIIALSAAAAVARRNGGRGTDLHRGLLTTVVLFGRRPLLFSEGRASAMRGRGARMAGQLPESIGVKAIGHSIGVGLGTLIGWLTAGSTGIGSALVALVSIIGGICGFAYPLIYRRYVGILGASEKRKGSREQQAYEALRESLGEGGSVLSGMWWKMP